MNSQDIHNLQESYRRVYEQVVPDPTNNRPMGTPRVNPDSMRQYDKFKNLPDWQMRNLIKDVNYGQQVKGPEKKLTTQVAHLDLFDLIKGHLLDEGYADTEESALVIMANMSEEWKQDIVEQMTGGPTDSPSDEKKSFTGEGPKKPKGWKPTGPKLKPGQRPGYAR